MPETVTVGEYVGAVGRRKWLVLTVVLAAVLAAAGTSLLLTPLYEAQTIFYVVREVSDPTPITGRRSRSAVMPLMNLTLSEAYLGVLVSGGLVEKAMEQFPDVPRSAYSFSLSRSGQMLNVYVRHSDPVVAADAANAIRGHFRDYIQAPARQASGETLDRLENEIAELESELDEARRVRADLLARVNVSSLEEEEESLQRLILNLEFDIREGVIKKDALMRQIETLGASRLHEQIARLEADVEAQGAVIAGLRSQLADANRRLRTVSSLSLELATIDLTITDLEQDLLNREVLRNDRTVTSLQNREICLTAQTALPPSSPVFPLMWLNVLAAGLGALLPGIGYAAIVEGVARRRRQGELLHLAEQPWVDEVLPAADGDGARSEASV